LRLKGLGLLGRIANRDDIRQLWRHPHNFCRQPEQDCRLIAGLSGAVKLRVRPRFRSNKVQQQQEGS
jgi:hypothetical protein